MATTGLNRAARTGNRREVARRLGLNVELSRQGDKKRADAGELLSDFSRIWGLANLEERKRLLRASLEAAYIEKSVITAVKPRPEFYNLIYRSSGPDGIRTRDLCLDRAAC